jgi:hypothetical protein
MQPVPDAQQVLRQRLDFSQTRLRSFAEAVSSSAILAAQPTVCIYVGGSFGRREASETSDLDIFLIEDDYNQSTRLSNVNVTLIKGAVITAAQQLGFPEFSNDAQFLQIHSLKAILEELGSPKDDYFNYFTTRLLLILESQPVLGYETYQHVIDTIIRSYYRDYHDHESGFRPIFLVNDIRRFWTTLWLNYEHKRNMIATDPQEVKAKHHLRKLKMRFSRLLSCFSMIIPLARQTHIPPEDVIKLVALTPLERLHTVADTPDAVTLLTQLSEEYVWFLQEVSDPDTILTRIADHTYRDMAFGRGRQFTEVVYKFLIECVRDEHSRRFLVM